MDKNEYDKIKGLLVYGISAYDIAKIVNRHRTTVVRIAKSKDFEDYKVITSSAVASYRQKKKDKLENKYITVPELDLPQKVVNPDKTLAVLDRIAFALERLADAWEREPKKGLFR